MKNLLDNIEEVVATGELFKLRVTGYSMLPLLGHRNDIIVVRRVDNSEKIIGRIAMFRGPRHNIIVHRVIDVSNDEVTLRGDGNIFQIEHCRREEIIGVVESVIRNSGKIVSCTTKSWLRKERMWLRLPMQVRRYALAFMRRWMKITNK